MELPAGMTEERMKVSSSHVPEENAFVDLISLFFITLLLLLTSISR